MNLTNQFQTTRFPFGFSVILVVILIPCLFMISCINIGENSNNPSDSQNISLLATGLLLQGLSNQNTNTPPTVQSSSTYSVSKTTHVYAQANTYTNWNNTVSAGVVNLSLDLYLPENAFTNRPAMILIHGGGFSTGSKEDTNIVAMANYFASRGWVCISINYRLISAYGSLATAWGTYVLNHPTLTPAEKQQSYAMYPAARDAKAAVRWLYANASTYGINTNYVTALGGSAGSFLANMLGITNPSDFRDESLITVDSTLSSTNLSAGSTVHTIIDHWGGINHMTYLQAITGQSRFDANDPPISIVHGSADVDVPITQAEALRDAYINSGAPYEYNRLEGAGHSAWSATINGKSLSENAFQFIVTKQNLTVE